MNLEPTSSPQSAPPPAVVLFPLNTPQSAALAPDSIAIGGARRISQWEELEEIWLPEERDLSHSGINE